MNENPANEIVAYRLEIKRDFSGAEILGRELVKRRAAALGANVVDGALYMSPETARQLGRFYGANIELERI